MILQISQKVVNFLFINYTVFLFDILTYPCWYFLINNNGLWSIVYIFLIFHDIFLCLHSMIFRNISIYIKHFFPDCGKGSSVLPHSTTIKKEKPFSPSLLQKKRRRGSWKYSLSGSSSWFISIEFRVPSQRKLNFAKLEKL